MCKIKWLKDIVTLVCVPTQERGNEGIEIAIAIGIEKMKRERKRSCRCRLT